MTASPTSPPPARAPAGTATAARRELRGWYMFDWGSHGFPTSVISVFLGPYLTHVATAAADSNGFVHPLGIPVKAGSVFPYVVSLSVILQVMLLPTTGALADHLGRKKALLAICTAISAAATMALFFLHGANYGYGATLFLIANMSYGASIVVYFAYLPELAAPDDRDRISSRGWAIGLLGGGVLLALNLALYTAHSAVGLTQDDAARISIASAGAWWAVFAVVTLPMLRADPGRAAVPARRRSALRAIGGSFVQLAGTLKELRRYPRTLGFLGAFLTYNDGMQAVIVLATTYGEVQLKLTQQQLIPAILLVQFIAFGGALLLGRMARSYGAKRVVLGSLVVWTAVVLCSYGLQEHRPVQFYALAVVIGVVLGGSQALSRSMFSHLIPRGREAEFFGFYEIGDRGTSWLGPLIFGLALQLTDSYRSAIVSLLIFFVVGFVALAFVNVRRGIAEAGNPIPAKL